MKLRGSILILGTISIISSSARNSNCIIIIKPLQKQQNKLLWIPKTKENAEIVRCLRHEVKAEPQRKKLWNHEHQIGQPFHWILKTFLLIALLQCKNEIEFRGFERKIWKQTEPITKSKKKKNTDWTEWALIWKGGKIK